MRASRRTRRRRPPARVVCVYVRQVSLLICANPFFTTVRYDNMRGFGLCAMCLACGAVSRRSLADAQNLMCALEI